MIKDKVEDILNQQNSDGDTAFHIAVVNGQVKVVEVLLTYRSSFIDLPNIAGKTPLSAPPI